MLISMCRVLCSGSDLFQLWIFSGVLEISRESDESTKEIQSILVQRLRIVWIVKYLYVLLQESHPTTVGERVKIDLGFHEGAWILTSPRSSPLADLRIFLILENDPEPYGSVLF